MGEKRTAPGFGLCMMVLLTEVLLKIFQNEDWDSFAPNLQLES